MRSVNARNKIQTDLGLDNDGLFRTIARDFEEAVTDDDARNPSPTPGHWGNHSNARARRGTVTTIDSRAESPPNSVKAFAGARRREREHSIVEAPAIIVSEDADGSTLLRTQSAASRRSQTGRRYTNETRSIKSFASNTSAEEDVCFPLHEPNDGDSLSINFEVLEDFIAEEEIREATRTATIPTKVFTDARNHKEHACFTSDGDLVHVPTCSRDSDSIEEKSKRTITVGLEKLTDGQRPVENRFEFFSSYGESTIHAAEFGDLVLPGEEVRTLFTLPEAESTEDEGVWWLNMNSPTVEEIRTICKAFGVHPLTIEDIATHEAREKIELFPSYYFACFRSFSVVEDEGGPDYEGFNVYVIVFREGTLSFSFAPNHHAANVRKRIAMLKDYVALSSDWICYAMM
jgi:magnesium transporter